MIIFIFAVILKKKSDFNGKKYIYAKRSTDNPFLVRENGFHFLYKYLGVYLKYEKEKDLHSDFEEYLRKYNVKEAIQNCSCWSYSNEAYCFIRNNLNKAEKSKNSTKKHLYSKREVRKLGHYSYTSTPAMPKTACEIETELFNTIFAFQIAEGFVHTSNLKKYVLRLLGFALITEIPFNLFYSSRWFNPYHQNVLFTLLLGLLAISVIDKVRKNFTVKAVTLSLVWLLLICLASVIGFVDYGFLGMITVVMFYILRDFPFAWLAQFVAMVLINVVFFEGQVFPIEIFGKIVEIPVQGFAVFALIPIWLYGGKKGRSNKIMQYGFYAFYPVHMLVLYLIKYFA